MMFGMNVLRLDRSCVDCNILDQLYTMHLSSTARLVLSYGLA